MLADHQVQNITYVELFSRFHDSSASAESELTCEIAATAGGSGCCPFVAAGRRHGQILNLPDPDGFGARKVTAESWK